MATGMLILVLGSGTKLQDLLMSEDKEYTGSMKLGATTSTQDREGEILEEKPVPALTEEEIKAIDRAKEELTFVADGVIIR